MIKKFNQFINESHVPGPGELGSARINIDDEEVEWFSTEPALQKLISDNKVALLPPELWYTADDRNTINTLEEFFPNAEFEMEDEEDYEEEESDGFDEENESMNHLRKYNENQVPNEEDAIRSYLRTKDPNTWSGRVREEDLESKDLSSLYKNAIYYNLYKMEMISRKNDGKLAGDREVDVDSMREIFKDTSELITKLETFFKNI